MKLLLSSLLLVFVPLVSAFTALPGPCFSSSKPLCSSNAVIEVVSPKGQLFARFGSVFSTTLYEPKVAGSQNPQKIVLRTVDSVTRQPIPNCLVYWYVSHDNGFLFPDREQTDAKGEISAYWVAGKNLAQSLTASIHTTSGRVSTVTIKGNASPHVTRGDSTYANWDTNNEAWSSFSIDVTPITFPDTTYYAAIVFAGGYCGIQNTAGPQNQPPALANQKVIFSVWDVNTGLAQVVEQNPSAKCERFGGEGTGAKCMMSYPWVIGNAYRFNVTVNPGTNYNDYTLWFTDLASNMQMKMGVLRYFQPSVNYGASSFLENYANDAMSCLDALPRTIQFSNVRYVSKTTRQINPINKATFNPVYGQQNNEICSNYYYGINDNRNGFLWSTGGKEGSWISYPSFGSSFPVSLQTSLPYTQSQPPSCKKDGKWAATKAGTLDSKGCPFTADYYRGGISRYCNSCGWDDETNTCQGYTNVRSLKVNEFGTTQTYTPTTTFRTLFDNDVTTYFDCTSPTECYGAIQLSKSVTVSLIRFYPRTNWVSRAIGGIFQGSNDGKSWDNIMVIDSNIADGWNDRLTYSARSYQYLRYYTNPTLHGNMAEIQFFYDYVPNVAPSQMQPTSTSTSTVPTTISTVPSVFTSSTLITIVVVGVFVLALSLFIRAFYVRKHHRSLPNTQQSSNRLNVPLVVSAK